MKIIRQIIALFVFIIALTVRVTSVISNECTSYPDQMCFEKNKTLEWVPEVPPENILATQIIQVTFEGGVAPYEWSIEGAGFSLNLSPNDKSVDVTTINSCGAGTVKIVDRCYRELKHTFRSEKGEWVENIPTEIGRPLPLTNDRLYASGNSIFTVGVSGKERTQQFYRYLASGEDSISKACNAEPQNPSIEKPISVIVDKKIYGPTGLEFIPCPGRPGRLYYGGDNTWASLLPNRSRQFFWECN
jgi:hypothetical protein